MSKHRAFQVLMLAAAVAVVCAAGPFQQGIEQMRHEADRQRGEGETPPSAKLRLLQACPGIVRALVIDYLWIRSESLKRKSMYHDADQQTRLICALQPRFPAVWRNRSWNLAYNISVKYNTARERWHWVTRGIELLRDEGLRYNPKALELYLELAWTYMHKVGGNLDDMHWAYKRFHAAEFHRLLGAPPPGGDADRVERYKAWFRPIVDAPDTEAELLADAEVAAFVRDLEALTIHLGLELASAYAIWSDDPLMTVFGSPVYIPGNETQEKLQALLLDPSRKTERDKALAYSRKYLLTHAYGMKPWWMLRMVDRYGPLDWRSVWSHSLYWASYGLYNCKGLDLGRVDTINTGRIVLTSLKSLVAYGQVVLSFDPQLPALPLLRQRSDWRFIDVCQAAYLDMNEFYAGETDDELTFSKYRAGHENWVRLAVQMLYLSGQIDKADKYLNYLKRAYRRMSPKLYSLDLEQFVIQTINKQGLTQRESAAQFVFTMVTRAYEDIAMGEEVQFADRIEQARYFWNAWNNLVGGDTRKVLEDFDLIQAQSAMDALQGSSLEAAMSIWQYIPIPVQQQAYDQLAQYYRPRCERRNKDFDKAFPVPPGMERFRRQEQRLRMQQAAPGQDTGAPWRTKMDE